MSEAPAIAGAETVRDEDSFDLAAAAAWLRENAADPSGLDGTPEVRQFTGGASNLTYLLRYAARDLILRRPPTGTKAKGAHDMAREHDIQAALAPVFPYVATMVAYCGDEAVIGSKFYVMDRLEGTILRRDIPTALEMGRDDVNRLCLHAIDILATLHEVDVEAAGLTLLGKGEGYVARQVGGWSQRYRRARTEDVGTYDDVMAWLDEHQPADVAQVLIHNDFRFDNLVLAPDDPTRIIGVLDWEMATIGDPLMDLGAAIAYWIQADDDDLFQRFRAQPTHADGMLTRAEVVQHYRVRTGRTVDDEQWLFYEVFGLFRLAVIAQQIYYRYYHRQTSNPAYQRFHGVARYLEDRCRSLIAVGHPS